MLTKENMQDLVLEVTRPHENQIKITAYMGDVYFGSATYVGYSEISARKSAMERIKYNGSLV